MNEWLRMMIVEDVSEEEELEAIYEIARELAERYPGMKPIPERAIAEIVRGKGLVPSPMTVMLVRSAMSVLDASEQEIY